MAGISVIAAFVFVIQNTSGAIDSTSEEIDANKFMISKNQSKQAELMENIEYLEEDLGVMKEYLTAFTMAGDSINIQSNAVNYDIKATVNSLVDGIEYRVVSYSPSSIEITGISPSEEEVLEYASKLRDTNRFSEVVIASINNPQSTENPDEPFNFGLSLIK